MNCDELILLEQYIAALRACLGAAEGVADRNYFSERLSAADAMRIEIMDANLGRAAGILNDEERIIGWNAFYGEGAEAAHEAFQCFADAVRSARVAGRPDAGFGH